MIWRSFSLIRFFAEIYLILLEMHARVRYNRKSNFCKAKSWDVNDIKYIFIINPSAGKGRFVEELTAKIGKTFREQEYEIYLTAAPKDATVFLQNYPTSEEKLCFVACGGDGTLNEVINGAAERTDCCIAVLPCGSGNDFVKSLDSSFTLTEPAALLTGNSRRIDLLRCGDRYCVNVCNIGFDAMVVQNMPKFKKLPFVTGSLAYILSIVYTLAGKMYTKMAITVDGEPALDRECILTAIANGKCYGGGFYPAPQAEIDDGYIDFCAVNRITRLDLIRLVGAYRKGEHMSDPRFEKYIHYYKCKHITITAPKDMAICLDGELIYGNTLDVEICPDMLEIIVPK